MSAARFEDAKSTCIGVLTGLYEYRTPKNGTVMSWANGAAGELARELVSPVSRWTTPTCAACSRTGWSTPEHDP